tara:strand:- start:224 stop:373 length:150 start_codon:yes stop_codon:yes gene_type:complete
VREKKFFLQKQFKLRRTKTVDYSPKDTQSLLIFNLRGAFAIKKVLSLYI